MKLTIDTDAGTVTRHSSGKAEILPIGTPEAFALVSEAWLRAGWDTKYVYGFSWLGRPVIQLPEDLLRIQELIYRVKPDVVVETGIAHGGSLVFYASLFKAMDRGRVIGVDIEIRPHNRSAIEEHELFPYITLIEGSSVDAAVVEQVRSCIRPNETVLVILDSNHSKDHVLSELEAYRGLVSPGSYLVATDGIMANLVGAPRSSTDWGSNNPQAAALEFVKRYPEFVIEEPAFPFNEGLIQERVTYWPNAFIRRIR